MECILNKDNAMTTEKDKPLIQVSAALICDNAEKKILICQRPKDKKRGLLWEFPGGKVEPGESKEEAVIRECQEELAVNLSVESIYASLLHSYEDITIELTLFKAIIALGEPQKLEHNDIKWIYPYDAPRYDFCPADREIVRQISKDDLFDSD